MEAPPRRQEDQPGTFDLPPQPSIPAIITVGAPAHPLAADVSDAVVRVPGSKYLTLRFLLAAALAAGESVVRNPALSEDTAVLVRCLRSLGAEITWERGAADAEGWALRVRGTGGRLVTPPDGVLQVGNAGAVLRMLLALGALLPAVRYETNHPDSLGRRPNADLLDALRQMGVTVEARGLDGLLPISLRGGAMRGGSVAVSGAHSSQFVSALLFLAPLLPEGLTIRVADRLVSASFVATTVAALGKAGITVRTTGDAAGPLTLEVAPGQAYHAREYIVPGDAPSAAALLAAGVALRRPLRLLGLDADDPDLGRLLAVLNDMGVRLRWDGGSEGLALALDGSASEGLHSSVIDGDGVIDSVPALAAMACLAPGLTRFERVAHLRLKESDRIGDLAAEFARSGACVTGGVDSLVIEGSSRGVPGGVEVRGHDDHRLVEALAVLACQSAAPLTILGAEAVAKSYPAFFADLARLGAHSEPVGNVRETAI